MLIQHKYNFNQTVWYYQSDLVGVEKGTVTNIQWDDETDSYKYTIEGALGSTMPYIVDESCIRDNEYEAHSLFSGYLDIVAEQAEAEYHKYRDALNKEIDWMRKHEAERSDA